MNEKILLIDIDSIIPNIALMRISTYHKLNGDSITLKKCGIRLYKQPKKKIVIDAQGYDRVYASAIFNNTFRWVEITNAKQLDVGGSGVDLKKTLPEHISKCGCDYSIYPENDTSYGFISRGCIRNCNFCIVREKEGLLHQVAEPHDIIRHKKVKFLDNNFLALKNHKEILVDLIQMKETKIQFNQGLDIRLIDDENAELLSKLNYMGEYIFAFDNLNLFDVVNEKLAVLKKYISKDWRIKFFLYCHPDMDITNDVYVRIMWCKEKKVLPYFMRDISCWDSKNAQTYNDFSAWCNQPGIFKTHDYETFCRKRRINKPFPECCPDWFITHMHFKKEQQKLSVGAVE